ncbi:hypothetical protein ACFW6C_33140 [Streptomyces fungicidicus]|uniref:hypothetical protein n=1 Tax=Streptomyces fungicidicus TaxID=68203 RepID=UPI0036CF1470
MALPGDVLTAREVAKIVAIGIRIERRRAYGKPTKALENQADRIREEAEEREKQRAKGRKKK